MKLGFKSGITKLINISEEGKLALIGSRISLLEWVGQGHIGYLNMDASKYPINIEYNYLRNEIAVST